MLAFLLYLDPGAGSLILQIILGGILASGLFIKNFWHQFIGLFKRNKKS